MYTVQNLSPKKIAAQLKSQKAKIIRIIAKLRSRSIRASKPPNERKMKRDLKKANAINLMRELKKTNAINFL